MPTNAPGLLDEVKDAISLRTVALIAGVLLVQVAFIASYVGAFHHQDPRGIEVGVVAPAGQADALAEQLNGIDGEPLDVRVVASADEARAEIEEGDLVAALVVDPSGTEDTLLVASARGESLKGAVQQVLTAAEAQQGRTIELSDVVPLQDGDARGMSGFYLVIGWLVGGYLVAALLGVAKGARPANRNRAAIRLAAMVPYAVLSGLLGALVVGPVIGAIEGSFWEVAAVGTLLVLSSATVTMALQVLAGTLGIGLTVLIFVVLGNPSAGGAYQTELLPGLWRTVGQWLPNGAGTTALREIIYFDGNGASGPVVLIAVWAVVGAAVALAVTALRGRKADL